MSSVTLPVGRGTATGIDPSLTDKLQESEGVVYKVGDPAAHKFPGRTVFNSVAIAADDISSIEAVRAGVNKIIVNVGSTIYSASPTVGTFSSLATLTTSDLQLDITTLNDRAYIVSGESSDDTTPFAAYAISNNTAYRMGLAPTNLYQASPTVTLVAGPGISGTFYYWITEYDSTHGVESAFHFRPTAGTPYGAPGASPVNQKVRITLPTQTNASADKVRIYRTIDSGTPLIGWLVAEVAIATATYDDDMTDATLVLQEPYRIVTINGISENMDEDPQVLGLTSIASFQGSLIATIAGSDLAFTPADEPHSWPMSYRLNCSTRYGGSSRCVRTCGDVAYIMFNAETFMLNYLPDESDAVFDTNICLEHVANYGTPSALGGCTFTAWGGQPILFVASLQGPILIAGKIVDRAVRNIDWPNTVELTGGRPSSWKVIDNPDKWRIEMFFQDDLTDLTSWKVLHFYYDQDRIERESGSLPEMAWTGPHEIPGPGTFGFGGGSGHEPHTWTGSRALTGTVYLEDDGTVDTALLVDSSGTINFRLRTQKFYRPDEEMRADRMFIHKRDTSDQDYSVRFTSSRENGNESVHDRTLDAGSTGATSQNLNSSMVSCDVRIVADGTIGMAPINNITLRFEDRKDKSHKTQTGV